VGITDLLKEKMESLDRLRGDPEASAADIRQAEEDLKTLDYLYENFNIGMNVFRTAKGGRDKIKE
jgi:colicin import membrane protein